MTDAERAEAAFVMVADLHLADEDRKRIEALLVAAIEQATAEGITDPMEIKRRIIAARDAAI